MGYSYRDRGFTARLFCIWNLTEWHHSFIKVYFEAFGLNLTKNWKEE
jgi:hypothetical protein